MSRQGPWANLTDEEYEARCDQISASRRAQWAKMSKAQRRKQNSKAVAAMAAAIRANSTHADCTHDTTPRARARCRAARKRAAS